MAAGLFDPRRLVRCVGPNPLTLLLGGQRQETAPESAFGNPGYARLSGFACSATARPLDTVLQVELPSR